jgi:ribosome-associated toxin RatA of RatAB toxin-antitoxin module
VNKTNKILVFFYIFLSISYGLFILTTSDGLEENLLELVLPKKITEFETSRLVDIPINRIFDVMADIENFPNILPKNILYVHIQNQSNNEIISEEKLSERGIQTKLLVKHTLKPYSEHIIEILEGDAKGTIITQSFESINSKTKLTTHVNLNLKGISSVIAFLPEANLVHAINTIISHFVDYSKFDIYEKTVNSVYQEILYRSADSEGLLHYSTLLRNEQMTEQDLRNILIKSDEYYLIKMKNIDELNSKTIIVIDDLYEKILLRPSDLEGMIYFGNLLETGTTSDEIRTLLLESDEGKNVSSLHPIRSKIMTFYLALSDTYPTESQINYYHKMIDDDLMTIEDVENELKELKKYKKLHN